MMHSPMVIAGDLVLKPALIVTACWLVTQMMGRRPAAARHAIWAASMLTTLALPVLQHLGPALPILRLERWIEREPPGKPQGDRVTRSDRAQVSGLALAPMDSQRDRVPGEPTWPALLLALWLLGVSIAAVRVVMSHGRARKLFRRSRMCSDPRLRGSFERLARDAGIRRTIPLRISQELATPGVIGILEPAVILPAAAERWPLDDVLAALIHEVQHIVRRDRFVDLAAQVTQAIYWWHPLVWFATRRLRAERERACDDRVVSSGIDPQAYAGFLLSVARAAQATRSTPVVVTSMARPAELESRLLALLDSRIRRERLPWYMPSLLSGLIIGLGIPAAGLRLAEETPAGQAVASADLMPEPDRLNDSLAAASSERLPLPPHEFRLPAQAARALHGPDSVLVRLLAEALDRSPENRADLVRERAAWALSQVRGRELVGPLLEALTDSDWRVQAYAAWALAPANDPRAVPRLIPLLTHPVWRLRAVAASTLSHDSDPRAASAMNGALRDPAWQVRLAAVEYFAGFPNGVERERLRLLLDDRHIAVRRAAYRALTAS